MPLGSIKWNIRRCATRASLTHSQRKLRTTLMRGPRASFWKRSRRGAVVDRTVGRPPVPKKPAKGLRLSVRFSEERRGLGQAAKLAGISLCQWARSASPRASNHRGGTGPREHARIIDRLNGPNVATTRKRLRSNFQVATPGSIGRVAPKCRVSCERIVFLSSRSM